MDSKLQPWWKEIRAQVERYLEVCFGSVWPVGLEQPLLYPLKTGGKRIRPALCFAGYEAIVGGEGERSAVLPFAAAVELIHTYSLVHDDLPAMDDDDLRRGQPTVHRAYDEGVAILVGDALLTQAFQVLANAPYPSEVALDLIARLAKAAGHAGMIGGQAADIGLAGRVETEDLLTRLHRLKTGALITVSVVGGGVIAGATQQQLLHLERVGECIGLVFQLADDLLDAEEDRDKDAVPSFVKLQGEQRTRQRCEALVADTQKTLALLPHPHTLSALAEFSAQRSA